MKLGYQFY